MRHYMGSNGAGKLQLWAKGRGVYVTFVGIKSLKMHHSYPPTAVALARVPVNLPAVSGSGWKQRLQRVKWKWDENSVEALSRCGAHSAQRSSKNSFLRLIVYD